MTDLKENNIWHGLSLNTIYKEYDDTVVSEDWKYIFLSDFQWEWKTRNYGEVILWDD